MRIIKIQKCDYTTFNEIRDEILDNVPFALINDVYHKARNTAYFYFWDSDYIPEELMKYRIAPPAEPKFDFSNIDLPTIE